jgi:lipoprotein NlpD
MRAFEPSAVAVAAARCARWAVCLGATVVLAGCAASSRRAPVEDRQQPPIDPPATTSTTTTAPVTTLPPPAAPVEPAKPVLPGAENAGKPGYYTVRPGDTLIRVATDNGQSWRDVARWNNIDNPNLIEVGQVLRVVPPTVVVDASGAVTRPVTPPGRVDARPLGVPAPAASAPIAPVVTAAASVPPASASTAAPAAAAPAANDDEVNWLWPAAGPVATPFDDLKSKGLAIAGKAGDPVLAAADGRVVYAGAGLRGYGNLVIVKHNATYLTAYAHNQSLLVKEDQVVRRGQKIAEMGSSDAERVQLHFEIRRQGKPIDPARLLPPR